MDVMIKHIFILYFLMIGSLSNAHGELSENQGEEGVTFGKAHDEFPESPAEDSSSIHPCLKIHNNIDYQPGVADKHFQLMAHIYSKVVLLASKKVDQKNLDCEKVKKAFFVTLANSEFQKIVTNEISKLLPTSKPSDFREVERFRKFLESNLHRFMQKIERKGVSEALNEKFSYGVHQFNLNIIDSIILERRKQVGNGLQVN